MSSSSEITVSLDREQALALFDWLAGGSSTLPHAAQLVLWQIEAQLEKPRSELTDADLSMIEQRCEAATPGPWVALIEGRDHTSGDSFIQTGGEDLYLTPRTSAADHDFIANARQDVPRLVREVRALRKLRDG